MKLINPNLTNPFDLTRSAKLSVHSLVNPNRIPLYARSGGSLEVHISDIATSQWLKTRLLSGLLLDKDGGDTKTQPVQQCPIGVLVSVKSSRHVTDVLIYGVLSPRTATTNRPRTPPAQSETEKPEGQDTPTGRELRIYGIPLNSENVTNARGLATPPESPPSKESLKKDGQYAEFLSNQRPLSPKRKRVTTLFEAATQHHRRVRRKGGEAVSQVMAGGNPRAEIPRLPERGIKREISDPKIHDVKDFKTENRKDIGNPGRERRRSISTVSERHPATISLGGTRSRDVTPLNDNLNSRRQSISNRGRNPRASFLDSHLTRSTTTPPPLPTSFAAETTAPAGSPSKVIAENKDLLTRTILTCMRLYGYHRNAKHKRPSSSHSRSSSFSGAVNTTNTTAAAESGTDEEEYKSMYHATYRASTFALRRYLNPAATEPKYPRPVPRLEKEKAMTMVDDFLKLFCHEESR